MRIKQSLLDWYLDECQVTIVDFYKAASKELTADNRNVYLQLLI